MNLIEIYSDQLYMWSVINGRTNHFRTQAPPQAIAAQTSPARLCASGLPDRALQALRQSELQMRRWSRPRSQVLPLGKLPGALSADGLRPSGRPRAGQRTVGQPRPGARHLGGDLRDQSRTASQARATLRCTGEPDTLVAHRCHRRTNGGGVAGQHAGRHDRGRPGAHAMHGGQP